MIKQTIGQNLMQTYHCAASAATFDDLVDASRPRRGCHQLISAANRLQGPQGDRIQLRNTFH